MRHVIFAALLVLSFIGPKWIYETNHPPKPQQPTIPVVDMSQAQLVYYKAI